MASMWNVRITSLAYYANLTAGNADAAARWNRALSTAFGKPRWIPAELLTMCGPLFEVTGGPRHSGVIATATRLRRWLSHDTWGTAAVSRATARGVRLPRLERRRGTLTG